MTLLIALIANGIHEHMYGEPFIAVPWIIVIWILLLAAHSK